MSHNNPYMFGSGSQPRSQNSMDMLQQQQSQQGSVELDLTQLVMSSNNGHGNSMMQNAARLQQGMTGGRPQQMVPTMQSPQSQQQSMTKKQKETVLKTPLSLLNEICSKAKTLPTFALEESGPVHSRVYNCCVKVEKQGFLCEATATGKTKKDAKQEAAKVLLLQMDKQVEKLLLPKVAKEEAVEPVIEIDPEVTGNPVGDLNDLCTKLKRLPPEYEDVAEYGKPHERVYTVACKLGAHIVETGRGRSKKHAKKVAAHRVQKRVMELLAQETDAAKVVLKDDDNLIEKLSCLTLVSKQEAKKISENWKLTDWVSDLRNRTGPKIEQLKKDQSSANVLTTDSMKLLKEIAEEQKFKLDFTELDQGNHDLKTYLIAVSADNQPLSVLMGSAVTKTQAKKIAAENFIDMLRLVLNSK